QRERQHAAADAVDRPLQLGEADRALRARHDDLDRPLAGDPVEDLARRDGADTLIDQRLRVRQCPELGWYSRVSLGHESAFFRRASMVTHHDPCYKSFP